jgi:hypothetical protein
MAMADDRRFEIDELLVRPGTYFNPQTEVLVTVDDSASLENEIFNLEQFEGADWVLISDELATDEAQRDELLENFQATAHGGETGPTAALADPEVAANVGDEQDDDPPPAVVPLDEDE